MAVLKCKMCGGELAFEEGATVCECEYCGSKQTIPNVDDEKRVKLYERANRLRLNNEFDKAYGVYESIIAESSEEAEAYWGLVLCKYGIEYVDDPATGDKVPTCHRSSFDSVMDDENFEMVMENADPVARSVYREQAKAIEEIRKGIIEVSSKEEPYDIFICYKETDENGDRTVDSLIAQDTYDALTEKGYKVFFSRITLEDKLGQEYEPYIFAALNSAKVMLVFGTDYEYFNAVWVKNEWSRFLQLMAKGEKKTLIPCYKNLDAYDIPKEFARLQAQDMGKVGALQDLVRGVGKIISPEGNSKDAVQQVPSIGALTLRGKIYLEDGEFTTAYEYFEKALDESPTDSEAYLGKVMAFMRVSTLEDLADCAFDTEKNKDFVRAIRYASPDILVKLQNLKVRIDKNYIALKFILVLKERRSKLKQEESERIRKEKLAEAERIRKEAPIRKKYDNALLLMGKAFTEQEHRRAAMAFEEILDYQSAAKLRDKCLEKAEQLAKERSYVEAVACMKDNNMTGYETACRIFETILEWKDSCEKLEECKAKIEEIKEKRRLQLKLEEEKRALEQAEAKLKSERRSQGVCQHCGGTLKGMFTKKCVDCGRAKDY